MSQHQAFRRVAVPQQIAQRQEATTIPAPTRGLVESENLGYMQPGAAVVLENWIPTMRGVKVRGGCLRWSDLHQPTATAWVNSHAYAIDDTAADADNGVAWKCLVAHSSPASGTFAAYRAATPADWQLVPAPLLTDPIRQPVISSFEYNTSTMQRMFAAQETILYDVTFSAPPTLVKSGQTSGNYSASQLSNQGGDYLIAVNDAGDYPLRFDGTAWTTLSADEIHADPVKYPGCTVEHGGNLVYVCKYRNRWFFIEGDSMNAWYLGINSIGGELNMIPLSGAASEGGKLLWCAVWSIDAGDGTDDKIVFATNKGEMLVFTGSDPSNAANWRQEGRYNLSDPLGMNAHVPLGGDILIATVEGIVPISAAITKTSGDLELAMITKNIKKLWRKEVATKRGLPWSMVRWDEYGGMFVTLPGGTPGKYRCAVVNTASGAWAIITGWDATCWIRMQADMFFGTQTGLIMQADRTGNDDGLQYTATMVGGWEMFQAPSQTITWRMARASFTSRPNANFLPYLTACTDYAVTLPVPPPAAPDPGVLDVWDQGLWDQALWDQEGAPFSIVRNTGWISIGMTGYSHAPVLMATFNQRVNPDVELVSIAATFERGGINV